MQVLYLTKHISRWGGYQSIFLHINENIPCRYSLEVPHQGASNKYSQGMFSWRNKKNVNTLGLKMPYLKLSWRNKKNVNTLGLKMPYLKLCFCGSALELFLCLFSVCSWQAIEVLTIMIIIIIIVIEYNIDNNNCVFIFSSLSYLAMFMTGVESFENNNNNNNSSSSNNNSNNYVLIFSRKSYLAMFMTGFWSLKNSYNNNYKKKIKKK